jgi:hypothetical protein
MIHKFLIVIGMLALTCSAASAFPMPTIDVMVGGEKIDALVADYDFIGGNSWFAHADPFVTPEYKVSLNAVSFGSDPFVTYSYGVQNFTSAPLLFTFVFSTTYVDGPYDILRSTHSDSFTNFFPLTGGGTIDNKVTVTPAAPQTFIHQPFVNGVPVGGINPGGTKFGPTGPFSGNFESGLTVDVPGAYPASGTLSIVTSYVVSAGDLYSLNGIAELVATPVPEPATYAFLGAGLLVLGLMVRRRQ